ncbi:MAG: zf-HC2 domain-containing protein [Planctomycetota bacterium]
MKCDEVKTLLNPYVDKELSTTDADRTKKHLEECPGCAKKVTELKRVKEMLRGMPALTAPSELLEGVRCNLTRPIDERQGTNIFRRSGWLTASLASAAAVILVVFTVMIQSRKNEIPAPAPVSEKAKASFTASITAKTETLDAIQAQPMLFTQQINISTRNVDNAVAKVYAAASTQTPDLKLRAEYQKRQAVQEEFLAKAPAEQPIQDENPTMTNSAAPLREKKIRQQSQLGQVVKISIPLSQKDAFIKQLKGDINVTDKLVLAEMQAIAPAIQQQEVLKDGYLADAGKAMTEGEEKAKGKEPTDQGTRSYDAIGKGGGKGSDSKQAEANKIEGGKSSKAKDEVSKDKPRQQPKPTPVATAPAPPPAPPTAPAPSAPARGKGDASPSPASPPAALPAKKIGQTLTENNKEVRPDKDMKKQDDADDVKDAVNQSAQSQPEAMIEFIIFIEPTDK